MARLIPMTPCAGLLPVTIGPLTLEEVTHRHLTSVMPLNGKQVAVTKLLKEIGLSFPDPNRETSNGDVALRWFGRGQAMLIGALPPEGLATIAAITDQSDAWAVISLDGAGSAAVLSRLIAIDLREHVFKEGHTARCQLNHMMASLTRTGPERFEIMVFRSMAATAVHELSEAMESYAARAVIPSGMSGGA